MLFAWFNWVSRALYNVVQSFSMYMPYADTTMFSVALDGHWAEINSTHWAWTALYNASPVRFDIFAPDAKSVVAHI